MSSKEDALTFGCVLMLLACSKLQNIKPEDTNCTPSITHLSLPHLLG